MRQLSIALYLFISLFLCQFASASVVRGLVVDADDGNPVTGAVVSMLDSCGVAVEAILADDDGVFEIETSKTGNFKLQVQLVGYFICIQNGIVVNQDETVEVGTIKLHKREMGLDEVVVISDKNKIVYRLDRQKIDVQSILTADAGSAADVLKSMPSVQVSADGEISLRGSSGFLVYVDGKKSMLDGNDALEQISSSTIENIEIITTPSARYRTDGDVGIINITTKRKVSRGMSATATATGTTMGGYSADLNLSYVNGFNRWYLTGTAKRTKEKSDFIQNKETLVDDYFTTSAANGTRYSAPSTYLGSLGWDLDKHGHYLNVEVQHGRTRTERGGDMSYEEHREFRDEFLSDNIYAAHDMISNTKHLAQVSVNYSWKINDRGDRFDLNSRVRYDWSSVEYTESNLFDQSGVRYEGTRGYESEDHWDVDGTASYTINYCPKGHLETGYSFVSYSEFGDYSIKYWDRDKTDFVWQDNLYAPFYYRRQIHSLYAMLTQKAGALEFDGGLRGDCTLDRLTISVANANRRITRWNLFPSAHILYNGSRASTFSAGYSYRTNRPGIWQLEPYITYEDYYTKLIGNPDIRPEYIHSAELGYRLRFGHDNTFAATAFWRSRRDVVQRVRVPYEPGVTLDSLVNAGNDLSYGIELSSRLRIAPWWTAMVNGSVFHYKFISRYIGCTSDSNLSYSVGLINNIILGKTTKLQFDGNFVGPKVMSQGREKAYCYFDVALRQQIVDKSLWASLVVHNLFHTARYESTRRSIDQMSYTHVRPKFPNIALSVTYTFNSTIKEKEGAVSNGAQFTGSDF